MLLMQIKTRLFSAVMVYLSLYMCTYFSSIDSLALFDKNFSYWGDHQTSEQCDYDVTNKYPGDCKQLARNRDWSAVTVA